MAWSSLLALLVLSPGLSSATDSALWMPSFASEEEARSFVLKMNGVLLGRQVRFSPPSPPIRSFIRGSFTSPPTLRLSVFHTATAQERRMGEWRRRADKSLATKCIVETQICHFYRWEVRPSRANAYKQAGSADRRWNVSKRSGSARCYAGTVRNAHSVCEFVALSRSGGCKKRTD